MIIILLTAENRLFYCVFYDTGEKIQIITTSTKTKERPAKKDENYHDEENLDAEIRKRKKRVYSWEKKNPG